MTAIELRDILRSCQINVDWPDGHVTGKFIMVAWIEIAPGVIVDYCMPFYQATAMVSKGELDALKHTFRKYRPQLLKKLAGNS